MKFRTSALVYLGVLNISIFHARGNVEDVYKSCKEGQASCFGMPNNCYRKSSPSCVVLASVAKIGDKYRFKLMRSDRVTDYKYVAIGITEQGGMNKASIVACKVNGGSVSVSVYWSDFATAPMEKTNRPYIQEVNGEMKDGTLFCEFDRNAYSAVGQNEFNLDEKAYAIILAKGDWDVAEAQLRSHGHVSPVDRFSFQPVKIIDANDADAGYQSDTFNFILLISSLMHIRYWIVI